MAREDRAEPQTPVVQPPPAQKQRGLKGRIIEKKKEEMKEELESAVALVHQYLPPSPDVMQVVMNAGTASIAQAGPGRAALRLPGYVKANDALTLTFDQGVKALQQLDVNMARRADEHRYVEGDDGTAARRHEPPGERGARDAEAEHRGADHELELSEAGPAPSEVVRSGRWLEWGTFTVGLDYS